MSKTDILLWIDQKSENDPDGFMMPYRFGGKMDIEVKQAKYFSLNNLSKGTKVRLYGTTYRYSGNRGM